MKKIYSLAMLLLAGAFALTSCDKDMDSNPVLNVKDGEPVSFVLNNPEFASQTVALAGTEKVALTWSQPVLTPENAPIGQSGSMGLSYAVQVSKDGNYTKTFDDALAEVTLEDGSFSGKPENYNYVTLATTYSACNAEVTSEELNKALNQLVIWDNASDMTVTEVFVRVVALMTMGNGANKTLAISNVRQMKLMPSEWIDVMAVPAKEAYLWMPGNGNGWNHGACPILVSQDGEVYSGYAYMNGEFKFTPVGDWSAEYNNGSFTTVSDNIDCGDKGGGNLNFTGAPGMYYFTVNLTEKSITATAVSWSIIGAFNSWADDVVMTYDEGNHCLSADVNFSEDTMWKFRRDYNWDVNLGGSLDALEQGGSDIPASAGAHTIQLFIERPAQDGLHAVVK